MSPFIAKILYRFRAAFASRLYQDKLGNKLRTVIIAGSARSGTTLLAEALNYDKSQRLLFEPFIQEYVPEWPFKDERVVLLGEQRNEEAETFLLNLSLGNLNNRWIDHKNIVINPKGRIIKAVRINLMLPWIVNTFLELPIIFIWRNPMEVISSRLTFGWSDPLPTLISYKAELTQLYPECFEKISFTGSEIYTQAVFWCLENKWPIEQLPMHGVPVLSLNSLLTESEEKLVILNNYLDLKINKDKFISQLKMPSQASRIKLQKRILSSSEINEIMHVLRIFKMEYLLT